MENECKVEETEIGIKTSHPSYGTLLFNRSYSGGKNTSLFGSSIRHKNTITMELYHADITRGTSKDWIRGNDLVARVEMSYSQFTEAITSFGIGTGVPVTIRYTEKDGEIPKCGFTNKKEQFANEFKDMRRKASYDSQKLIKEVSELFSTKKTLTKADREAILEILNRLDAEIGRNTDYIAEQFNEQMDKTIMEAKGEIESFMQNKIHVVADHALQKHSGEILKLDNPVDII